MRPLAARLAPYMFGAGLYILLVVFVIVAGQYKIAVALLVSVVLSQSTLWVVRVRRIHASAGPLVPAVLARLLDSPRRQRVVPAQLPPPAGLIVGRDAVTDQLYALLSTPASRSGPRLVLISGEPGVGKTALAINVAHLVADDYPDGQLALEVDARDDGWLEEGLERFVWSLKGPGDQMPPPSEYAAWFRRHSRRRRLLIVLDNVPNLEEIGPLLPASSRSAVLVTTRTSEVPGLARQPDPQARLAPRSRPPRRLVDTEIRLGPLGDDDAWALLSRLIGGDLLARQPEYAQRIVRAAAGYPVALHMAGAALTLRQNGTLEVSAERLSEIASEAPDCDSIPFRGILDLCFALLTEQERRAAVLLGLVDDRRIDPWMLVALFRGAAPESMAVTESDGKQLFDRLTRLQLLERRYDDSSGLASFRMRSYVYVYARAYLGASVNAQVQRAALECVGVERRRRAERGTEEYLRDNVYQLLDAGQLDDALSEARQCVAWSRELATADTNNSTLAAGESLTLAALAEVYTELGWIDEGITCARLAKRRAADSRHTAARARRVLGTVLRYHHWGEQAVTELSDALQLVRAVDAPLEQVRVLRELVAAYAITDEPSRAITLAQQARAMCDGMGWQGHRLLPGVLLAHAQALRSSARQHVASDALVEATEVLLTAEAVTLNSYHGHELRRPWIRLERALVALDAQQPEQSRALSTSVLEGFSTLRHRYGVAHARLAIGRAYLAERSVRAIEALEESHGTFHQCGDRWMEASCAVSLADAYLLVGRIRAAIGLLSAAEGAFAVLGDDASREDARSRLWTVESSYPSEPLFGGVEARYATPRTMTWPAP